MYTVRTRILHWLARANRHLNPAYLELLHQGNYFAAAKRAGWLLEPPISSARGGTASYSFLYSLLRLLSEYQGLRILELGAGATTALTSAYARTQGGELVCIDDDHSWLERAVPEHDNVSSIYAPLAEKRTYGRDILWYEVSPPGQCYDVLLVDGPMAFHRDIRFSRLGVLDWVPDVLASEFVVIIDDADRIGESMLASAMTSKLKDRGIHVVRSNIIGASTQAMLLTERFRFLCYI